MQTTISIKFPTDENGMTSRECPECENIFKVKFGTGITDENLLCTCPYCGYKDDMQSFHTKEQVEYAESIAMQCMYDEINKLFDDWGKKIEISSRNSPIKIKLIHNKLTYPISTYQEKELETNITCDVCQLEYAIYGKFAYCPDCGSHNSLQIFNKSLDVEAKKIHLSSTIEDKELAQSLQVDPLINSVSAFDGFGRALLESSKLFRTNQLSKISFQNIENAREKILNLCDYDIKTEIIDEDWAFLIMGFQKRHLLSHRSGVIDEAYLERSGDTSAILGRKVVVTPEEVIRFITLLRELGLSLNNHFNPDPYPHGKPPAYD